VTGRKTVKMPADDAGTCFRPVIHSHTVTTLAAIEYAISSHHDDSGMNDGEKPRSCQSANGATSTSPHRLMRALIRLGPIDAESFLPMTT